MICPKCKSELNNDVHFCGNCGANIEDTQNNHLTQNIQPALSNSKNRTVIISPQNKKHFILVALEPIICIILFLITKFKINLYDMVFMEIGLFDISKLDQSHTTHVSSSVSSLSSGHAVSSSANTATLMPLLVIGIYFGCIWLPIIKSIVNIFLSLNKNTPLNFKNLTTLQIRYNILFALHTAMLIGISTNIKDKIGREGPLGLNVFGWLFIIISIASIVHLFYLKSKYKNKSLKALIK